MDGSEKKLEGNIGKFYVMSFLDGAWLMLPIYMIFFLGKGMTLTEVGLLFGTCSLTQFLFEIPSSIWADKYSRRPVLIVYGVLHVLIDAILLLSGSFGAFFVAMILSGIDNALVSGTYSALVYDTVLSLGRSKEYERIQSSVNKSEFGGRIFASLFGAALYFISPALMFVSMILVHSAYTLVAYSLREPSVEKSISASLAQVREGIRFLEKGPAVWYLLFIFSLMNATSNVSFDYYQPVFGSLGVLVMSFGVIYVFINVCSFWGADLYPRLTKRVEWKRIMEIYLAIDILAALFLGSGSLLPVALAVLLLSLSFGAQNIYIGNIIHKSVPSSHRATALSIQSQMSMFFYFVVITAVSYCADHFSLRSGLLLNATIAAMLLAVFLRIYSGRGAPRIPRAPDTA